MKAKGEKRKEFGEIYILAILIGQESQSQHRGGDVDGEFDLLSEPVTHLSHVQTAGAVADQNHLKQHSPKLQSSKSYRERVESCTVETITSHNLLILRQRRDEVGERLVVVVEGQDGASVGPVDSAAGEVYAGDFVAGILHETPELVPAPSSAADSMDEDEMRRLLRGHFGNSHLPSLTFHALSGFSFSSNLLLSIFRL